MRHKHKSINYWFRIWQEARDDERFIAYKKEKGTFVDFASSYTRYVELGSYTEEAFDFRKRFAEGVWKTMQAGRSVEELPEFQDKANMYDLLNRLDLETEMYRRHVASIKTINMNDQRKEIVKRQKKELQASIQALSDMRNWLFFDKKEV